MNCSSTQENLRRTCTVLRTTRIRASYLVVHIAVMSVQYFNHEILVTEFIQLHIKCTLYNLHYHIHITV